MTKDRDYICAACVVLNTLVPWALLLFGAGISVLGMLIPVAAAWHRAAAYMAALGLFLFAASFILMRITDSLIARR